ncbi:beta-propeller domain-containing protein [Ruminococcus sp.]|uniref:beta-propeller domain-containing protein n=1 Tax=Ruminococcus sp. TaxID=41978 RepID=UPI0025EB4360|nr:beta-propeller domain-containing protein [Ruminococcus sp.]MBQ8965041.1 beta-propeller domain-containing protein [Ruminococcus sp.]
MRKGSMLKELENSCPMPDRLSAESIKQHLERNTGVIRTVYSAGEVKLNDPRKGLVKSAALAAAFLAAVAGLAVSRLGTPDIKTEKTATKNKPAVADSTGLTGLHGASYESLYNYLTDSIKGTDTFVLPDNTYVYNLLGDDAETSREMRNYFEAICRYDGESELIPVTEGYSRRRTRSEHNRLGLVKQENGKAYCTESCGVTGYILNEGEAERIPFDFLSDTFLMTELAENWEYPKEGTYLRPMVVGVVTLGDSVAIAYDFHLPEVINEKIALHEYCGFCVYDVSDTENVKLMYEYEQPGLMEEFYLTDEGRLTIVGEYGEGRNAARYAGYTSGQPKFLPEVYENGKGSAIGEDSIYIANKAKSNIITVMSSFDMGDTEIKNTDVIAMTLAPTAIMATDEHMTFASFYSRWNDEKNEEEFTQHLISVDTAEGLKVAQANYVEGTDLAYRVQDFSEENGIRYLASDYTVIAVDDELNMVGEYNRSVFYDYSKDIDKDNMVIGDDPNEIVFSNIIVMDGSTAYFCDSTHYSTNGENIMVREIVDMSEPASPKARDVSLSPWSAPAVTGGYLWYDNYFRTDDDTLLHIDETYMQETKLQLISIDPDKSEEATARYYYADEVKTDEKGTTCYETHANEEYKVRMAGVTAEVGMGTMLSDDPVPSEEGYSLVHIDSCRNLWDISSNGYIFLPLTPEIQADKQEITEKEYTSLPLKDLGKFGSEEDENGDTRYYRYENITAEYPYLLLRYSEDSMEIVGKVCGRSYEFENMDDAYSFEPIGCVIYGGCIYGFTERGCAATRIE